MEAVGVERRSDEGEGDAKAMAEQELDLGVAKSGRFRHVVGGEEQVSERSGGMASALGTRLAVKVGHDQSQTVAVGLRSRQPVARCHSMMVLFETLSRSASVV